MALGNYKKTVCVLGAVITISASGLLGYKVWRDPETTNDQKKKEPVITERYVRPEQRSHEKSKPGIYQQSALKYTEEHGYVSEDIWTSWEELEKQGIVSIQDGILSTEMDDNDGNYKAMEYITGAVVLPDDVKTVAKGTFGNCNISELVVPEGVKDIGENAFAGCGDLIRISLPESLKNIGAGAFSGCGVIHLKVPGGVEKIGMDAFYDCKIENLKIPDSVKKIGSGAFEGITHIEYKGKAAYKKDSKYWGAKSMN